MTVHKIQVKHSLPIKHTHKLAKGHAVETINHSLNFLNVGVEWYDYGKSVQQPAFGVAPPYTRSIETTVPTYFQFSNLGNVNFFRGLSFENFSQDVVGGDSAARNYKNYGIRTLIPPQCQYFSLQNTKGNNLRTYQGYNLSLDGSGNLLYTPTYLINPNMSEIYARYTDGVLQIPQEYFPPLPEIWTLRYQAVTEDDLPTRGKFVLTFGFNTYVNRPMLATEYNAFFENGPRGLQPKQYQITIPFDATKAEIQALFDAKIGAGNCTVTGTELLAVEDLYLDEDGKITRTVNGDVVGRRASGLLTFTFGGAFLGRRAFLFLCQVQSADAIIAEPGYDPDIPLNQYYFDKRPPKLTNIQYGCSEVGQFVDGKYIFDGTYYFNNANAYAATAIKVGSQDAYIPFRQINYQFFQKLVFDHLDTRVYSNYIDWLNELSDQHGWGYSPEDFTVFDGAGNQYDVDFEPYGFANNYDRYLDYDPSTSASPNKGNSYAINGFPTDDKHLIRQIRSRIVDISNTKHRVPINYSPFWARKGGIDIGLAGQQSFGWWPIRGDWSLTPKDPNDIGRKGKLSRDDFTCLLPSLGDGTITNTVGQPPTPSSPTSFGNNQVYPVYSMSKSTYKTVVKPLYQHLGFQYKLYAQTGSPTTPWNQVNLNLSNYTHFKIFTATDQATTLGATSITDNCVFPISSFGDPSIITNWFKNQLVLGDVNDVTYDSATQTYSCGFIPASVAGSPLFQQTSGLVSGGIFAGGFAFGTLNAKKQFVGATTTQGYGGFIDQVQQSDIGYFYPKYGLTGYADRPLWFEKQFLWKHTRYVYFKIVGPFGSSHTEPISPPTSAFEYLLGGVASFPTPGSQISASTLNSMMQDVIGKKPTAFETDSTGVFPPGAGVSGPYHYHDTYEPVDLTVTTQGDTPNFSEELLGGIDRDGVPFGYTGREPYVIWCDKIFPYTQSSDSLPQGTLGIGTLGATGWNPKYVWNGNLYYTALIKRYIRLTVATKSGTTLRKLGPNSAGNASTIGADIAYDGGNGYYHGNTNSGSIGFNGNLNTDPYSGPGAFASARQDINDLSYAEIDAAPSVSLYRGDASNWNSPIPTDNYPIGLPRGADSSNTLGSKKLVSGYYVGTPNNTPYLITGNKQRSTYAYFVDTRGQSLRSFLGVRFAETIFSRILTETTDFTYRPRPSTPTTSTVDERNAVWTPNISAAGAMPGTPFTFNQNAGSVATSWIGGAVTYDRGFTATVTVKFGKVTGNLRLPLNVQYMETPSPKLYSDVVPYISTSGGQFGSAYRPWGLQAQYIPYEVRHQQMMDQVESTGTTLLSFTVDESMFPDLHTNTYPYSDASGQVSTTIARQIQDLGLLNLSTIENLVPSDNEVLFFSVSIDMSPTGSVTGTSSLRNKYGITKIGPRPFAFIADGCGVSNVGSNYTTATGIAISATDTARLAIYNKNYYDKRLSFGPLTFSVKNKLYQ